MRRPVQRNAVTVGMRLHVSERQLLESACRALREAGVGISLGQLVSAAALEEAMLRGHPLSLPQGRPASRRRPSPVSAPLLHAGRRLTLTLTIHPLHLRPIHAAAEAADAPLAHFLWHATLGFLRRCQEAAPRGSPLARLQLP